MSAYTVKEADAELGCGTAWLYQQAAQGRIPHQRYGRSIRFTSQQLEQIRDMAHQPAVSSRRLGRAS